MIANEQNRKGRRIDGHLGGVAKVFDSTLASRSWSHTGEIEKKMMGLRVGEPRAMEHGSMITGKSISSLPFNGGV